MAAPIIFRSSDPNAPVLSASLGSLTAILDAILVDGYGTTFASGSITSDGVQPVDGDTVTVGAQTYTFKTTGTVPGHITIQGTATATIAALRDAINLGGFTSGVFIGTPANPTVWCSSATTTVLTLTARKGGAAGNSLALARASAGTPRFTVSAATLSGGGGTNTKASAGWTKPYSGIAGSTAPAAVAVYRQPAGSGFYLQVDEGSSTSGGKDSRAAAYEVMTAYNAGTGQFPTSAITVGLLTSIRKSAAPDNTARPWIAFADDRTFYLFTLTGDVGSHYHGFGFGDFVSNFTGDTFKCMIAGGSNETTGSSVGSNFGSHTIATTGNSNTGHYLPRNVTGIGGTTGFAKMADGAITGSAAFTLNFAGGIAFPNTSDGGLYVAPIRILEGSTPAASLSGNISIRGRMRGLYQVCHSPTSFVDGDLFTGVGEYAGRSFQIVKFLQGSSSSSSFMAVETTAWDT